MTEARTIKTKLGQEVELTDKNFIHFADGLIGFEDYHDYALVPQGDDSPFLLLQSVDEPQLAFLTIDPRFFVPTYLPELSEEDLRTIDLKDLSQAVVLSIVVIPEDAAKMTANLQAPAVINVETRRGRQLISRSGKHKIRHYILAEPETASAGA